jgi:putative cardiolipin synthase
MRHGSTDSALHAKVIVYDRKVVWVGSANSDPRSRRLNTEAGLLIESEDLAQRVLKGLEQDFSPQHSWRLTLEPGSHTGEKSIVWSGEQSGKPVRHTSEPDASLWRHLGERFYSILPGIEGLL